MDSQIFTAMASADGVLERTFTVGDVPGVLWSPTDARPGALVLMAHSGGLHKRAPGIVARARHYASQFGFAVAAIDAPGHGDRPRNGRDRRWVAALLQARANGEPLGGVIAEYNASLAERAVPEWRATLDALLDLAELDGVAVGFGGMTLGTATGLMLMPAEPRIAAASLGGVFVYDGLLESAGRVAAPLEMLLPWDDEEIAREPGLALFDAIGSPDKVLHVHPGRHNQVPAAEVDNSARFFHRHLTPTATTAA